MQYTGYSKTKLLWFSRLWPGNEMGLFCNALEHGRRDCGRQSSMINHTRVFVD